MRAPRIQQIESYILSKDVVSLEELCQTFEISMSTLRRDLVDLQEKGSIKKVYGGVCRNYKDNLIPFHTRSNVNASEKDIVCQLTSKYIENNDIIFIDTGSTTSSIIEYLAETENVTVVTNNLDVIIRVIPYNNIQVLILPGMLNRENNSFSPTNIENIFQNYNIDKAFLAASGVSLDGSVSHRDPREDQIKKAAIQKAAQRYLLIDNSKFFASSLFIYSQISDFDVIFTNQRPPEEFLEKYHNKSVKFIFPDNYIS